MPRTNRKRVSEHLYSNAELLELRRQMLRFSRSVPAGPERNQHLQVAISLRRLFKNKAWLDAPLKDHAKAASVGGLGSAQ
jgi:hypothetical protein